MPFLLKSTLYICNAIRDALAFVSASIVYVSRGAGLLWPYPRTKHWNRPPFGTSMMRRTSTTNPPYLYFCELFAITTNLINPTFSRRQPFLRDCDILPQPTFDLTLNVHIPAYPKIWNNPNRVPLLGNEIRNYKPRNGVKFSLPYYQLIKTQPKTNKTPKTAIGQRSLKSCQICFIVLLFNYGFKYGPFCAILSGFPFFGQ